MEDRISILPEEILFMILSFLTMREAAQTSVLSRRWRHLWKFIYNLNFDCVNRKGSPYDSDTLKVSRPRFTQWVNHVISIYRALSLDQFTISHNLNPPLYRHVDRWISFAVAKRVKCLELELWNHGIRYTFPPKDIDPAVNSLQSMSLKHLHLCSLDNFKSLRSLSLSCVYLTDETLESCLSNCLCLENLRLSFLNLVNLKVIGSSMKSLEILSCGTSKSIEIYAENLKSLTYSGQKIFFYLRSTPQLVDVKLRLHSSSFPIPDRLNYVIGQFASNLVQLETLVLELFPSEVKNVVALPTLHNLKVLVLLVLDREDDFLVLTNLLQASPLLVRFELILCSGRFHRKRNKENLSLKPHQCLREVEVGGFRGFRKDKDLIKYLLKIATNLERITVDTHGRHLQSGGFNGIRMLYANKRELQTARKCAKKLQDNVPPGIDFVVL